MTVRVPQCNRPRNGIKILWHYLTWLFSGAWSELLKLLQDQIEPLTPTAAELRASQIGDCIRKLSKSQNASVAGVAARTLQAWKVLAMAELSSDVPAEKAHMPVRCYGDSFQIQPSMPESNPLPLGEHPVRDGAEPGRDDDAPLKDAATKPSDGLRRHKRARSSSPPPPAARPGLVANVKVGYIRPRYADLRAWCADPDHVYVGRAGVVFVPSTEGVRVFCSFRPGRRRTPRFGGPREWHRKSPAETRP